MQPADAVKIFEERSNHEQDNTSTDALDAKESSNLVQGNTSTEAEWKDTIFSSCDVIFYALCVITGQFFITRRFENEGTHMKYPRKLFIYVAEI